MQSYPGDLIARERDLEKELSLKGKVLSGIDSGNLPPCTYSINAFGPDPIRGFSNPPDFFYNNAQRTEWDIPEATVCVWPYESMYGDDVKNEQGHYDNDRRSDKSDEFFDEIKNDKSLIFYYSNYSNPFSEEENRRYILIGVSRVKEVGNRLLYDNATDKIRERYADGLIWARNISSHYPNEGLRLPYHRYRNDPETLARIAVFPENPRTCKFASRHLSNDDAIGLLEQFLSAVHELKAIGDTSENWDVRESWLLGCIAELWNKRGLYPGLLNVMHFLGANTAIVPARELMERGNAREAHRIFFGAVDNGDDASSFGLFGRPLESLSRQWNLKPNAARSLLRDLLPRLDLSVEQIKRIVSEENNVRQAHGLPDDVSSPIDNPFVLSEGYVGDRPDDTISWSMIDRGVLPSPELGGEPLADMEFGDARRLRALCVEHLRREPNQTFRSADAVLGEVKKRLANLPEWKRPLSPFTEHNFEVDRMVLEESLVLRYEGDRLWLYLSEIYEDEREVERALTELSGRADIELSRSFDADDWRAEIRYEDNILLQKARKKYQAAVEAQAKACAKIFRKPLSVITGAAGTGKTSVICAIIRAIRKTEGDGAPITVLTPTGKASDRVRELMNKRGIERVDISTIHSYLATRGWLNDNLTLKRFGGRRDGNGTIVVDEASMLDLVLMASLMRAIDWRQVRRLILVGDPNQLPPIGRGRVFADTIQWLIDRKKRKRETNIAHLKDNLRQLENTVNENGKAILKLANLFIVSNARDNGQPTSTANEKLLVKVHKGGDIDDDLRIIYWDDPAQLSKTLIRTIEMEMEVHTNETIDQTKPFDLWRRAFEWKPEKYQILTPHRGDLHGVEALNKAIQDRIAKKGYATLWLAGWYNAL